MENTKMDFAFFEKLGSAGIDTSKGLEFCIGNEELYMELLREYVRNNAKPDDELNNLEKVFCGAAGIKSEDKSQTSNTSAS